VIMPMLGFLGMPNFSADDTSIPSSNAVPFDAMGSMMGLQMPNLPQRDGYGRYGLTEGQQRQADNVGYSQALMGAAQAFMGGGAAPALQGGMNAGNMQRQMLDKASMENVANYKLQVEDVVNKLNMIQSKSAIELQQMNIKQEAIKLQKMETQRAIASEFAKEMEPVADKWINKATAVSPSKGQEISNKFKMVRDYLNSGELDKAEAMFQDIQRDPVFGPDAQTLIEQDILDATAAGLAKYQADANVLEGVKNMPEFKGFSLDVGPNGQPTLFSPWQQQLRDLQRREVESRISENEAQAASALARAGAVNALRPAEITKMMKEANKAIEILKIPAPLDVSKRGAWEKDRAVARQALMAINIDPDSKEMLEAWGGLSVGEKMNRIRANATATLNAMNGMPTMPQMGGWQAGVGTGVPAPEPKQLTVAAVRGHIQRALAGGATEADAAKLLDSLASQTNPLVYNAIRNARGTTNSEKLLSVYRTLNEGRINPQR